MTQPALVAAGQNGAAAPIAHDLAQDIELKAAIHGFTQEFDAFQAEITRKFSQQEERLTMLDRKTALSATRPTLS